jgi:probable blue pigment (indigoidine) exporter
MRIDINNTDSHAVRPGGRAALVITTALAPMAWGTTYLVTTEVLPAARPLLAGCLRALPAGVALAAFTRARPIGAWWWKATVLGALNIGGFFALLFIAAYRLPGGVAATLGAVQPLLAAGLAAFVLHEPLRRATTGAAAVGVAGVSLLVLRSGSRLDPVGIAAALAATTSMATGVVLTKKWRRPVGLLAFTSWQLIAGGLFLVPLVIVFEGVPESVTVGNVAGYAWLASSGGAVAYSLWFRGIHSLPVAQVSILGLLSPVVAAVGGWIVLDQTLNSVQLIGMAAILAAVVISQTPTSTAPTPTLTSKPTDQPTRTDRKAFTS